MITNNEKRWVIKHITEAGYYKTWVANFHLSTLKGIMQTLLFITRNQTLFILKK